MREVIVGILVLLIGAGFAVCTWLAIREHLKRVEMEERVERARRRINKERWL